MKKLTQKSYFTGLRGRFLCSFEFYRTAIIRNVFPKDNAEWLNWVTQGKLLYADKERIQTLIGQQRRTLAEVDYLDLNSITKIVKDFENPKFSGQ